MINCHASVGCPEECAGECGLRPVSHADIRGKGLRLLFLLLHRLRHHHASDWQYLADQSLSADADWSCMEEEWRYDETEGL